MGALIVGGLGFVGLGRKSYLEQAESHLFIALAKIPEPEENMSLSGFNGQLPTISHTC